MEVVAIHRGKKTAMMDDGALIPVDIWLDGDGDECEPDEAVVAVVGPDAEGWWHPVLLSSLEPAILN